MLTTRSNWHLRVRTGLHWACIVVYCYRPVYLSESVQHLAPFRGSWTRSWSGGHKVGAITKKSLPTNFPGLLSFLGSVQFCSKFIQNLSTLTELLTHLIREDMPWWWGAEEWVALQQPKDLLCKDTVPASFDRTLQIGISCDASDVGIGVALFHCYMNGSECPIKTLTDTQCWYSQIEKEALAVIYGLKKFHHLLYRWSFNLVTDRKPLVTSFGFSYPHT